MTTDVLTSPHLLLPTANPVAREALLERICVRPPYFALRHTGLEPGVFVATAEAELPQGRALGPMRPGDLSRHGAIAGLCAVALRQRDDQRRYYLATDATFTGLPSSAPYGAPLQFRAEVSELDKRSARAFVTAYAHEERVATLDVGYTVLPITLFERLHAARRQPTRPGVLEPLTVRDVVWKGDTGTYRIPALPAAMCAGHFDNYPAAPVALLMDQLAQIAERFVDRPSYIALGHIKATRLCWAGDEVVLSMKKLSGDPRETQLEGQIVSGDALAGEMRLTLRH